MPSTLREDNMDVAHNPGAFLVELDPSVQHRRCQAIIEGVRCITGFPVAEFQIVVGNTAIGIALCEGCKSALADEHPDWMFTQLGEFE